MKNAMRVLMMSSLLSAAAAPAMAEGFYGAIDLGQSHGLDICQGAGPVQCAPTATAFRIAGGYQFAPQWAAELSYGSYGNASLGAGAGTWETKGFQLSAIASLPVADKFSLFTKVGLASTTLTVTLPTLSASRLTLAGGFGARYDFSKAVGVRAQYENLGVVGDPITTGTTRLSLLTAGVVVKF